MRFGVKGIQKCQKFLPKMFFLRFWAAIMHLQIALKYYILFFLISYLEEFQPVK